jgi:glycerol dehydrogenase-like iron-containing ADH family enzyme
MSYSVNFASYTIGVDAYQNVTEVCEQYGKKILLIGGELALKAGKEKLESALKGSSLTIVDTVLFGTDCTYARMEELALHAKNCGADMIFGMGGGKALDTAKGTAEKAKLPIFTFPTIAATCAATTALSVVYREDGNFDSFYFYDKPARHCFIDTEIIANAPECYLRAGIGDTLGKYFECHFAARGDRLEHSSALGREISNMCYFPLREYAEDALIECRENKVGTALEQAVLANIVSTGLASLLVLDQYNCAIAHSVYYALVLLPGFEEKNLHGDVVAYGVLVQLMVDGEIEQAKEMKTFLEKLGIRTTLKQMGAPMDRESLKEVLTETVTSPDMEHIPYEVTEEMIYDAMCKVENL